MDRSRRQNTRPRPKDGYYRPTGPRNYYGYQEEELYEQDSRYYYDTRYEHSLDHYNNTSKNINASNNSSSAIYQKRPPINKPKKALPNDSGLKSKLPTGPKGLLPATSAKRSIDDSNSPADKKQHKTSHSNLVEDDDVFEKLLNKNKYSEITAKSNSNIDFKFMIKLNTVDTIHERIQQVGEGTYGKVYKAKNKITNELVALKRLRLESEREGFPITANREVGLLQSFNHPNIVGLIETMVEKNQIFMVFPYMNHDLSGILQQSNIIISDGEKKNLFRQLLKGIEYLHLKKVIHRDIKGSNILINNNGILKITDFGLARRMKNYNKNLLSPNYTNRVITLWYRPPEILLGSTDYGREVDIWGIGCILLELFVRKAIFQGTNEVDQLWKVYDIMGTINSKDWPDADNLPWYEMLRPNFHSNFKFREKFGHILTNECFNLAVSLLKMNPNKRIKASDALNHPYFDEEPKECKLDFLKKIDGEWHEYEAKQKRKQKLKEQQQQQQQQQQQHQQQEK